MCDGFVLIIKFFNENYIFVRNLMLKGDAVSELLFQYGRDGF